MQQLQFWKGFFSHITVLLALVLFAHHFWRIRDGGESIQLVSQYSVLDGDTLLLKGLGSLRLRFIDAPEMGQTVWIKQGDFTKKIDMGALARRRLIKKLGQKPLLIKTAGRDRYGRLLGEVMDQETGENLNIWIVKQGLAEIYVFGYDRPDIEYYQARHQSIKKGKGIWNAYAMERARVWRKSQALSKVK
jgi:endonuclease YncB( thermonuclease family)